MDCLSILLQSRLQMNSMLIKHIKIINRPIFSQTSLFYFSHKGQKKHFFKIIDKQEEQTSLVYPNQYPTNLVDSSPLVPRGRPVRFITPKDEIPELKQMSHEDFIIRTMYNDKWKSPQNAYRLNVGLIGPINSGKSELITKLSHKISAVSPKINTTDEILHAYKSFQIQNQQGIKNVQLKYFDTPGLSHNKTGYLSRGWKVLGEIDFSLLVIDSSKKFDDLLEESIKRLEKHRNYEIFMKALVLNKIDLVQNKRKFHGLISEVQKYGKFDKIFYTSALTGYGVKQIEDYLIKLAKKGSWDCPKQVKTQSSELQICEQLLKQALFHRVYNQVPYSIMIQCQSISSKTNGTDFIQFRVMVEDENVQRMVIGTKGLNINWVRDHFKTNYAKLYKKQVEVHVRVTIKKEGLIREQEELETSYHHQSAKQDMKLIQQSLEKQGKMIRR